MNVRRIALSGFRNYEWETAEFSENTNIITGENAQGKTNLLESIYFSSFIRSFRTSSDKEMISFGKDHLRVCSSYSKNGETDLVEVAMDRSGRKIAKINGARQERLRDVVSDYYVVVFSP
jgi:DNA replication and repair protein RecF